MKLAVVLFNLGGPDKLDAVEPFLHNLFNDPAIIRAPGFVRAWLARMIARRRAPVAREIYAKLGGGSPLLANTQAQARALATELADLGEVRVAPAMRYWHPMADAVARDLAAWSPEQTVLLPLYPQFSTATTASSLDAWRAAATAAGLRATTTTICCYPENDGFVTALAAMTREALADLAVSGVVPRVLFSAHGLPERVIKAGDPYQWQVERTAAAVTSRLARPDLETVVCYQSRVGPLKWIGPSTEEEIRRCGSDGRAAIVVPLAFVSEHSETLVELDIEYRDLAAASGVPAYRRVATVGTHPDFIAGLAANVRRAILWSDGRLAPESGVRICPVGMGGCPCREVA